MHLFFKLATGRKISDTLFRQLQSRIFEFLIKISTDRYLCDSVKSAVCFMLSKYADSWKKCVLLLDCNDILSTPLQWNKNEEINQINASIDRFFSAVESKTPSGFLRGFVTISLQILANELHLRLKLHRSNETFMTYWKLLVYLWLRNLQTFSKSNKFQVLSILQRQFSVCKHLNIY